MHAPLGDPLDVVVGRIGGLLGEEQEHALKHLVAIESCGGHVEKQTVQHSLGDEGKHVGQEREADTLEEKKLKTEEVLV